MAQLVVKKTCHAYATIAGLIKTGRLQGKRAAKATSKPVAFRADAAQAFDDRCLSWQMDARTVSIWTVQCRMRHIAFTGHPDQLKTLDRYRHGESDFVCRDGESDFVCRDGRWFLIATVDVPDAEVNTDPADFIGVDMGIVNIATSSDGDNYAGAGLRRYRKRMAKVRAELQAKATKSAKKKLKARSRREARAVKDNNHRIAKQLVASAERTGRGIGMEDLAGVRDRVRLTAAQRTQLVVLPPTPGLHRLQGEKSRGPCGRDRRPEHLAAVPTVRAHRQDQPAYQGHFACVGCGLAGPADQVAAVNVRDRARKTWAFVNTPNVADTPQPTADTSDKPRASVRDS